MCRVRIWQKQNYSKQATCSGKVNIRHWDAYFVPNDGKGSFSASNYFYYDNYDEAVTNYNWLINEYVRRFSGFIEDVSTHFIKNEDGEVIFG